MNSNLFNLKFFYSILLLVFINIVGIKVIELYEFRQNELNKEKYLKLFIPIFEDSYSENYGNYKASLTMNFNVSTRHIPSINELIKERKEYSNKILTLKYILKSNKNDLCNRINKNKLIKEFEEKQHNNLKVIRPVFNKTNNNIISPCTYLFEALNMQINILIQKMQKLDDKIEITKIRNKTIIHIFN